jgi:hypothetical protein
MQRGCGLPTIVDVVAEIFDEFLDKVSANRFVLAAANFDVARSCEPRVSTDSLQGFSVKRVNERRS